VPSSDLAFLELADLADSLSLPRFRALDLRVETKPDVTPVTDADRAVERALRELIAGSRRGEGVVGEEEGGDEAAIQWVIDPIDGTKNFSRGVAVWATLIALERESDFVCGVISAPALGHRWWAARGERAFRDGERIHVSAVSRLADASVSLTYGRDLVAVAPAAWHARSLGDFWQHALVAEGSVDAAVDARLARWDYAALVPLLEEAGGPCQRTRRRPATPEGTGRQLERVVARRVARAPESGVAASGTRVPLRHSATSCWAGSRMLARGMCTTSATSILALADAVADACGLEQLTVTFGIANRCHCLLRQLKPSDEAAKPAPLLSRPDQTNPAFQALQSPLSCGAGACA
jgi:histidinol-phosphatase